MPTFTNFILTFPTVNRKFLITDFRLLSTSVKPENFIDFYRSQKKVKDPRCLDITNIQKRYNYLQAYLQKIQKQIQIKKYEISLITLFLSFGPNEKT